MKFYFTYSSSGMAYKGGWTEVEAPSIPLHRGIGLTGSWIDKPITVAPTLMVADLKEAIEEGEPRAEFVQATFEIDPNDPAHLIPTVEVNIRDE